MVCERGRQRIVEARAADIQRETELPERMADPARGRMLLVENDQDRLSHDRNNRRRARSIW
jgi:hypothetical protein